MTPPTLSPDTAAGDGPRWTPTADTTVDALLAVAAWTESERTERGTPWAPGHEMHYSGIGGMQVRDNRRVTVAADNYSSRVDGARTVDIKGDLTVEIKEGTMFSISPSGSGSDNLHVKGNMYWDAHDKMIIGTGRINRTWYGPVKRITPMEGIICGGAYTKAFLGTSTTIASLGTGDVFGGAARTSASRSYVASIAYRSADNAVWQLGLYSRRTINTLEPLIGSPSSTKPFNGRNHLARVAAKISMAVMPFLAILVGIASIPFVIGLGIWGAISWLRQKFFGAPARSKAATLPRVRSRTCGVITTTVATYTET